MRKLLILITMINCISVFSQNCERTFNTTLTYSNSELGLNYNNLAQSIKYRIFQRTTSDVVSTSCDVIDIKRPIIICEGYDIFSQISTQDIYDIYINNYGYGDLLRSQGYDIITYNLNVPQAALQPNALLFANFIEFINKNKIGNEENIVVGVSMGGVLGRYALAYMEKNNIPHNTRLFVSFDSPQQGANVPLSLQALTFDLSGVAAIAAMFGETDLIYLYQSLISQGSLQLISNFVTTISNGASSPHQLHNSFFNELRSFNNSFGYPQNCRKIAISDGSYKADLQKPYKNSIWGKNSGNPAIAFKIKVLGMDFQAWSLQTAPGIDNFGWDGTDDCILYHWSFCDIKNSDGTSKYALKNNVCPLDHSPGGFYPWFKTVYDNINNVSGTSILMRNNDNACFVPTISALDLNTNDKLINISNYTKSQILADSPFDDIWWNTSQDNIDHTYLTYNMGDWLYKQIVNNSDNYSGVTDKNISDVVISENSVFKATNSISFSNTSIANNTNVTAIAGNSITLKSGFQVPKGSTFSAKIEPVKTPKNTLAGNLPNFQSSSLKSSRTKQGLVSDTLIDSLSFRYALPEKRNLDYLSTKLISISENDKYFIYPNPSNGYSILTINLLKNSTVKVDIISITGNIVSSFSKKGSSGLNNIPLNLKDVQNGIYIVSICANNSKYNERIVINK